MPFIYLLLLVAQIYLDILGFKFPDLFPFKESQSNGLNTYLLCSLPNENYYIFILMIF